MSKLLSHKLVLTSEVPGRGCDENTRNFVIQRHAMQLGDSCFEKIKKTLQHKTISVNIFHDDKHTTSIFSNTFFIFTPEELADFIKGVREDETYAKIAGQLVWELIKEAGLDK